MRDISQQDKNELQHTAKELEKLTADLTSAQQRNESLKEELAKAEDTIDELKEQVKINDYICNDVNIMPEHTYVCYTVITPCLVTIW